MSLVEAPRRSAQTSMDVTYYVIAIMAVVYGDDSEIHVILHVIERLQASDIFS